MAQVTPPSLLPTFFDVCLLVGVGGGALGKADVRLGDVLVSNAVEQYDIGTTGPDGLRRRRVQYQPPQELRTAISRLRAQHEFGQSRLAAVLSEMGRQHQPIANTRTGIHSRTSSSRALRPCWIGEHKPLTTASRTRIFISSPHRVAQVAKVQGYGFPLCKYQSCACKNMPVAAPASCVRGLVRS
ncbi:hypothetical protein B0T26DRAFT_262156 [Lasiosphaeria miniovina]|uniref:Nucleoside phosphorylase domain-containing protein n=1 Tax=Lasiosphaeria miniovina TaxID=1954250 RepID=A0AA40AWW9_9PEZI|nr:uncharacterized protein B0T26DRAFT_262156 [Lasiosphaeria miniovina]KAK0723504.1 hypothetical protein B0T26DRAFT_262156 [Lasiosphaeria miniovina]